MFRLSSKPAQFLSLLEVHIGKVHLTKQIEVAISNRFNLFNNHVAPVHQSYFFTNFNIAAVISLDIHVLGVHDGFDADGFVLGVEWDSLDLKLGRTCQLEFANGGLVNGGVTGAHGVNEVLVYGP